MFPTAFAQFFDPRKWPLFLFGAVAVAVIGNSTHDLCKKLFGEETPGLLTILALFTAILIGSAWTLRAWMRRPAAIVPPSRAMPMPRRGLILLVGMRDEACREAIRHHSGTLTHLWLVCSAQSTGIASRMTEDEQLVAGVAAETVVVADVYDPLGAFEAVLGISRRLPGGLQPADVIADFTGLTATASVGLVLACLQTGIAIEYTPAEYSADGRALRPLPPHEVVFGAAVPPGGRLPFQGG